MSIPWASETADTLLKWGVRRYSINQSTSQSTNQSVDQFSTSINIAGFKKGNFEDIRSGLVKIPLTVCTHILAPCWFSEMPGPQTACWHILIGIPGGAGGGGAGRGLVF